MELEVTFPGSILQHKDTHYHFQALLKKGSYHELIQAFADLCINEEQREDVLKRTLLTGQTYKREEALYYFAISALCAEEFDEASLSLNQVGMQIGCDARSFTYTDMNLLSNQMLIGMKKRYEQDSTLKSILVFSTGYCASSFISGFTSSYCKIPRVRVSMTVEPNVVAVPHWIATLDRFPGITHDHTDPKPVVIDSLRRYWKGPIFIQVRDPREAAWSYIGTLNKGIESSKWVVEEAFFLNLVRTYSDWVDAWLNVPEDIMEKIHFLHFDDIKSTPVKIFEKLIREATGKFDQNHFSEWLMEKMSNKENYNFRKGDSLDWKNNLPSACVEKSVEYLSNDVRRFLSI
jgi:hypothetical protein